MRLTLLAALCHRRTTEITDGLVDLLIQLVDKIDAKAERKVEKELLGELRKVAGKEGLLFRIAEAAVDRPDETVRAVIWPVAGPGMLRQLVAEAKANKKVFNAKVRTVLRSSYSHHYRRVLPDLLAALEFRSGNDHWRPVVNALAPLQRCKDVDVSDQPQFAAADQVPVTGVVSADWRPAASRLRSAGLAQVVTEAAWWACGNSSIRLPARSASRTWRPPGPETNSLRNDQANATESVDLGVQVVDEPGGRPARAGQTRRRRPAMA